MRPPNPLRPLPPLCPCLLLALAIGCDQGQDGAVGTRLQTGAPSAAAARFVAPAFPPAGTIAVPAARAALAADLDGDGGQDLVTLAGTRLRLFLRTGTTTFAEQVDPVVNGSPAGAVATLDVDGDGDLDLIVGGALGRADRILLNDGTARFQEDPLRLPASSGLPDATAIAVGDVDRDGRPDLLIGRNGFPVQLYLAQPLGSFLDTRSRRVPAATPAAAALLLVDLDLDGDLDVLVGAGPLDRALLWLNDGQGFFRDLGLSLLPADSFGVLAAAAGDVDQDGDVDLLVGRADGVHLWDNERNLRFLDRTAERVTGVTAGILDLDLADLDADGDLELLASGVALFFNDAGRFERMPAREPEVPAPYFLVLELEPGGPPDLMALAAPGIVVFRNQQGSLRTPAPGAGLAPGLSAAEVTVCRTADLDRDLIPDLVLLREGSPVELLGGGAGDFRETTGTLPSGLESRTLELADLDQDGDPDLLLDTQWLRNDGTGVFVLAAALPAPRPVAAVAAGDVDGDTDVDIVATGAGGTTLLLNDGAGGFTDRSDLVPTQPAAAALLLLDVDLDQDLDLLLGGNPATAGPPQLFVNMGGGAGFKERTTSVPAGVRTALVLAAADLDGDLDPDVVLGVSAVASENLFAQVLLGDGAGGFLLRADLPGTLGSGVTTRSLALADLDGDLRPDLVAALTEGRPNDVRHAGVTVFARNTGLGLFEVLPGDLMGVGQEHGSPAAVLAADLDLDGDADLVAGYLRLPSGGGTAQAQVRFNLLRHLLALGPAWIGGSLALRVYSRPGQAPADLVGLPFQSLGGVVAPQPPAGTWLLAPLGLTTLPPVALTSPAGAAEFAVAVPPALQGQTLHFQVLIARLSNGAVELTNAVVEPVR